MYHRELMNKSFSSTEIGSELELSPSLSDHAEVSILKSLLNGRVAPISIFIGNLPYTLAEEHEIVRFLELGESELAHIKISIMYEKGKPKGRAIIMAGLLDIAYKIIDFHGKNIDGRPVFMNLDGFFGRGQGYKKQLDSKKETKVPWWHGRARDRGTQKMDSTPRNTKGTVKPF